jgi:uncharacterized protein
MKERTHDPRRLDVAEFARSGAALRGRWPLAGFARLMQAVEAAQPVPEVEWSAQGAMHAAPGGATQPLLHLCAAAHVAMQCQRCLQPVAAQVEVDRRFRFAQDEREAERLDAESEDDVLALTRELDLHALLEDELLLGLPLVPRHGDCAAPRHGAGEEVDPGVEPGGPFSALAALRGRRDGGQP